MWSKLTFSRRLGRRRIYLMSHDIYKYTQFLLWLHGLTGHIQAGVACILFTFSSRQGFKAEQRQAFCLSEFHHKIAYTFTLPAGKLRDLDSTIAV